MVKKKTLGAVLGELGYLKIRQVLEYEGYGKKRRCKSSYIAIFNAKKELVRGFKNKDEALVKAKELLK